MDYDGFRLSVWNFIDFFQNDGTLSGLFRKSQQFFTNLEVTGYIRLKTPDGAIHTIFDASEETSIAFATPIYFSAEYIGEKEKKFTIQCDLRELDSLSNDDSICEGEHEYRAQSGIPIPEVGKDTPFFSPRKFKDSTTISPDSPLTQEDLELINKIASNSSVMFTDAETRSSSIDLLVKVAHFYGYEKLYSQDGASDLRECIEVRRHFYPSTLFSNYSFFFYQGITVNGGLQKNWNFVTGSVLV